jgi:hypothetical protein
MIVLVGLGALLFVGGVAACFMAMKRKLGVEPPRLDRL